MEQIGYTEENLAYARRICEDWKAAWESGTAKVTTSAECIGNPIDGVDIVNMGPISVARAVNRGYRAEGINRVTADGRGGLQLVMVKDSVAETAEVIDIADAAVETDVVEVVGVAEYAPDLAMAK